MGPRPRRTHRRLRPLPRGMGRGVRRRPCSAVTKAQADPTAGASQRADAMASTDTMMNALSTQATGVKSTCSWVAGFAFVFAPGSSSQLLSPSNSKGPNPVARPASPATAATFPGEPIKSPRPERPVASTCSQVARSLPPVTSSLSPLPLSVSMPRPLPTIRPGSLVVMAAQIPRTFHHDSATARAEGRADAHHHPHETNPRHGRHDLHTANQTRDQQARQVQQLGHEPVAGPPEVGARRASPSPVPVDHRAARDRPVHRA